MNDGDDGNKMAPIGRSDDGYFSGNFDGQGHTISNLHISEKVVDCAGLFALNNGTISGVTLAGCTVTGNEDGTLFTGGIVGMNGGTVSGCHITGTSSVSTTGASTSLGGIVGRNDGTVSGCTSAATVSATASIYEQKVGGIVGYNGGGTVSGCGNTGGVAISGTCSSNASYYCGGIVGYIYNGTVSGCINTGAVSIGANGYNYAGGIAGSAESDASVTIENCANGGAVTATGGTKNGAGGIVGFYYNSQYVLKDNFYFGACTTKGAAEWVSEGDAPQNDVTDDNGAVRGYAVTAAEGVTGVTVAPAMSVATVDGGDAITSDNYFMEGMTVTLGDYTGATAEGFNGYTAATADGSVEVSCAEGAYSFAMPAEAVTVAPAFMATMTGVSYINWDGKAATTPEGVNVWVLSGATTGLTHIGKEGEATWYVVTDSKAGGVDAAFTSVSFRGHVRLILADGAEMQVGTADGYNNMIGDAGASLHIFGQTAGTGALHVNNLEAGNFLDICGGKVTADEAICAVGGGLGISGGQVSAGTAIYARDGDMPTPVTITLRRATDYVYAGSNGFMSEYGACPVVITGTLNAFDSDGKYCGSVSGEETPAGDADVFCGKTLRLDVWGMADSNDGTAGNPYKITTEEGLRALSELSKGNNYSGKYFELGGNITMSDEPMAPIGNDDGGFSGHFDGQGHTISNLHISEKVDLYAGLFAVNTSTISGVTLAGCTVTDEEGTTYTGGIAGLNIGEVSGCHITGTSSVTGASFYLGGIVGKNNGTMSGCTSAANVRGTAGNDNQYVGGIVGWNDGTVSGCGNTGGVDISGTGSSTYYCGGIVGENFGKVSGCINTGAVSSSVSGDNFAGGIAGCAGYSDRGKIENCANGGKVTASGGTTNCAGGIVGFRPNDSQFVLTNNFYFGACKTKGAANAGGSFDVTANNGAVAGYAVTVAEGVTGVTVAPAVSVATVDGGEAITSGQYYGAGMTVTLGDYTGDVPEGKGLYGYTAATADGSVEVSFAGGAYSFAMPAEAVNVAPDFWDYMTKVSYIDVNGEAETTTVEEPVWVLSSATTAQASLGKEGATTWYVVTDSNKDGVDAAFTSVSFRGDVRLILADGAEMQVGNANGGGSMEGEVGADLEIFGQTAGTGALHVNYLGTSCNADGLFGVLDISGGKVTADEAIGAEGGMSISGGQVTAGLGIYTAEGTVYIRLRRPTDYVYAGEYGFAGNGTNLIRPVIIAGKLFSIDGDGSYYGSVSGHDVAGNNEAFKGKTLRAAKYADTYERVAWYISDREHNDVVRLANVPTTVPTLTNTAKEELRSLYNAGQIRCIMVAEADEAAVRMTWTELSDMVYADRLTLFAPGATNTWGTFCADGDYLLPEGCTAYTLSGICSGTVTVSPMEGDLLPACVPVMVHRTADVPDGGLTASFEAAMKLDEAHGWTFINEIEGNMKTIADDYNVYYTTDHSMSDLAQGVGGNVETNEVCYLMGNTGAKGAFAAQIIYLMEGQACYALYNDRLIRIEGNQGISRHRCIVGVPGDDNGGDDGGKSRQLTIVIADGEPTAIDAAPASGADAVRGATEWYTLDGRKVDGRPTRKGVYISGGRKVVVK